MSGNLFPMRIFFAGKIMKTESEWRPRGEKYFWLDEYPKRHFIFSSRYYILGVSFLSWGILDEGITRLGLTARFETIVQIYN